MSEPIESGQVAAVRQATLDLRRGHGPLQFPELIRALRDDGLMDEQVESRLLALERSDPIRLHPLLVLAQGEHLDPSGKPLSTERLTEWLAQRAHLPYLKLDPLRIDFARIAEVMSSQYAIRHGILPVALHDDHVVIATAQPRVTGWEDELAHLLRREVRRVIANPQDIARYTSEFFSLARSVRDAQRRGGALQGNSFEQLVELGAGASQGGRTPDANDQHIVGIVDWLWQYAFEQRASDIHLEPRRETGLVRMRIDGVLNTVYRVPPSVMAAMTSRIKLLGRMDVVERRRPQDGRIKTRAAQGAEVELRLSTLPTAFGEKLVMRIFDPQVLQQDLGSLGFAPEELARWRAMSRQPHGIVLVTGPTGSGKTTTLYATLRELATDEVNVCTLEDPIEMVDPMFNQVQVQPGIEFGFADGLKALMRQDPDIIMIGEIRDLESAELAVQAALTGHLVFASLHTNDAPSAVMRLLDLGVPAYLLKATLLGVLAQRLVRTLCPQCKTPDEALEAVRWEALTAPWRGRDPRKAHRAVGCPSCRSSGFKGRIGLYELLTLNDGLRQAISEGAPDATRLRQTAMREGWRPLRLSGALKVAQGLTTLDEVLRHVPLD